MRSSWFIYYVVFSLFVSAASQEDTLDGERCNDVILYDIIKKASKTTVQPAEIRKNAMETMQKVFPLARSMGCICTDHNFKFPDFTNHRYCSVTVSTFKCHAIVF